MADDVAKLLAEIIFEANTSGITKAEKKLKQLEKATKESDVKISAGQQKQMKELRQFIETERQARARVRDLNKELKAQKAIGADKSGVDKLTRELDIAKKYQAAIKDINAARLKAIGPKTGKPLPPPKMGPIIDKKQLAREIGEAKTQVKELDEILNMENVLFPKGLNTKPADLTGLVGDYKGLKQMVQEKNATERELLEARKRGEYHLDAEQFSQDDEAFDVPYISQGDNVQVHASNKTQEEYNKRHPDSYKGHEVYDDKITPEGWKRPTWKSKDDVYSELLIEGPKLQTIQKYFEAGKQRKKVFERQKDYVEYLQAVLKEFDEPGYLEQWLQQRRDARGEQKARKAKFQDSSRGQEREKARVALSKIKASEAWDYKKKRGLNTQWDVPQEKLETRARDAFILAKIQEADYQRYLKHEKRVSENIPINKQIQDVIGMPGPGNLEGLPAEKLKEKKRQEMMTKLPFNDPNYKFTIPNRPPPVTKVQLEAEKKASEEEPKKSKYITKPIKQAKPRPPKDVKPEVMEDIDKVIDDAIAELSIDAIDDAISQPVVRPEKKKIKQVKAPRKQDEEHAQMLMDAMFEKAVQDVIDNVLEGVVKEASKKRKTTKVKGSEVVDKVDKEFEAALEESIANVVDGEIAEARKKRKVSKKKPVVAEAIEKVDTEFNQALDDVITDGVNNEIEAVNTPPPKDVKPEVIEAINTPPPKKYIPVPSRRLSEEEVQQVVDDQPDDSEVIPLQQSDDIDDKLRERKNKNIQMKGGIGVGHYRDKLGRKGVPIDKLNDLQIMSLVTGDKDKITERIPQSILDEIGNLDLSENATSDINSMIDGVKGDYHQEGPTNTTPASMPIRPSSRQARQELMLKDFNELLEEAEVELKKALDQQRRGIRGQYPVEKARYRLNNIEKAIQAIKMGDPVWIDKGPISPYEYHPDILKRAQERDKFDPRPAQYRKERIDALPDDLRLLAAQKKIHLDQAENIAFKRDEVEAKKRRPVVDDGVKSIRQRIGPMLAGLKKKLDGIFSQQMVTMTGEFDTEEDMEEWISKLQEFGGVSGITRREKDVKMRTPEGPVTQRRHVGTVTLQKTTEDLLKQKDALKLVNQAVVENGKAYTTSSKVAGKYTAGLAQGFTKVGNQFRALSWKFTMMSMGSLGVFFSMMSFATLLRQAFGSILGPLTNLEQTFQQLGMAIGLEDLSKIKLEGESPAERLLGDTDSFIEAWATIQYLVGQVAGALTNLGIELLQDPEFVESLQEGFQGLIDALGTPEFMESIKSLAQSFVELLPQLIELVPWVAEFFTILTTNFPLVGPLLPWLVRLALIAAALMPIFSVVSMVAGLVAVAFQAGGWVLATLLIPALQYLVGIAGLTVGALAGIVVIILAVIAVIAIVLDYFGLLDDVVNAIIATFQFFFDVLSGVCSVIAEIFHMLSEMPIIGGLMQMASQGWNNNASGLRGAADWMEGLKWADRDTGETAFESNRGVNSTRNDVTVNQTIYGTSDPQRTADLANEELMKSLNTSIH